MDNYLSNEDILTRLKHLHSTIECGIHSGYPPCCIKFYITQKIWMPEEQNSEYIKKIIKRSNDLEKSFGYIPCPACLESGNDVKLLPCPNNIPCEHGDENAGSYLIRNFMLSQQLLGLKNELHSSPSPDGK